MFYEFDTIKYIKNFEKYDVWCGRTYYVIFQKKYGSVLFGVIFLKFERITVVFLKKKPSF